MGDVLLAAIVLAIIVLVLGLRIANQYQRAVIFRLGKLHGLRGDRKSVV